METKRINTENYRIVRFKTGLIFDVEVIRSTDLFDLEKRLQIMQIEDLEWKYTIQEEVIFRTTDEENIIIYETNPKFLRRNP